MANEGKGSNSSSSSIGGIMDEEVGPPSGGSSPKNKVKFLCSHGGKIMPRPADGQLKYIGGETRVIAVPRDITFSEIMKKLSTEFEGDMILKYQVMHEDLDVLVSVKTDEDLKHMFKENDRQESGGTPKLRAFLFPSNPTVLIENQNSHMDPYAIEKRYIDAVNGAVRTRPNRIVANRPTFSISACSSPKSTSPDSNHPDSMYHESTFLNGYASNRLSMHRVKSSPSFYNLNTSHCQNINLNNHHYQHQHHLYQQHPQHLPYGYQHMQPPYDPHHLAPALSLGRCDIGRNPTANGISQWHLSRHRMGSGNSTNYAYYDEHLAYGCRIADKLDGLPKSPRSELLE